MPRNYSRKTDRQDWDKTSMEKAIEAVKNNEPILASKVFNVPQSTLRRHALKQNKVLADLNTYLCFRKNMKQELIDEAPIGTMGIAQESGWMTTAVFYKWLVHFQLHVKASLDNKVFLIVDGHISHKGAILNKAYGKAATVQTAVNGFQKTGLWPVDPYIFPDYLFEPAETTNIHMQQDWVEPEEDSTAAENLCIPSAGPSQVEARSSTSLIIASTSAADNPRPLSVVQSRDKATAIPTTPTSSKLILQELSPAPKGINVAGQVGNTFRNTKKLKTNRECNIDSAYNSSKC
ncbi:unnamed protein product [Parnassius apollo]|uniref:(apollo) hypothetical protein n=1 Tax=Parnassius apollo TaxID=110799 RepID=A0A8S3XDA3_PARAO|nr:unnamed protein product [Parnassius apollo]